MHRLSALSALLALLGLLAAPILRAWWPLAVSFGGVLGVGALNAPFFGLLRRAAGWRVALVALPIHVIFYLSNGISAVSGWLVFSLVGAPQPPADVAAFDEVGVETWPPVPSRPKESVWYEHGR